MRPVFRFLLLSLLALTSLPVQAVERLAVLELTGELSAQERGLPTDSVRSAVVVSVGDAVQVMTRENMEVMRTDMGTDTSCIAEGACEVETARNLNGDYGVSGSIVGMGDLLGVSLKLHETETGRLVTTLQARGADGPIDEDLARMGLQLVSGEVAALSTTAVVPNDPTGLATALDGARNPYAGPLIMLDAALAGDQTAAVAACAKAG
jgi:hypothetical protein